MNHVSRREFVTGLGVALSFTVLRPGLVRGTQANSRVRIGVVGCGGRGTWITDLFLEHGGYELVGAADYFEDRVRAFGEKFKLPEKRRYEGLSGYKRLIESGVRGTLLEGLAVDRLELAAGRTTVVIEPAELRMNWPDLLRWRLQLTTARADTVRIDIAPRPPDAPDDLVQPLVLPVVIATDSLEIGRLLIRNGVGRDGGVTADIVPVEIGPVVLRGELVAGELHLESLRAELYGLAAEATGVFGTGEPFPLDARVDWEFTAAGSPLTGSGKLSGDLANLRFEQVVRLPSPVSVGGVARLLQDRPEVFAEARWTGLERPLGADPGLLLRSATGRLRVRGWTDRFTADLAAALRLGDWPGAQVAATLEGDPRQVRVPDLRVDGFGGRVTGAGSVTLRDAVSGTFRLEGQRIDPAFVDPRFAGRVDFSSEVSFDDGGNFRVVLPEARGTLFDRPLRASGTVARAGPVLSFADVRVHAGANRVEFSGTWGDRLAGQFRIDAPELAHSVAGCPRPAARHRHGRRHGGAAGAGPGPGRQ